MKKTATMLLLIAFAYSLIWSKCSSHDAQTQQTNDSTKVGTGPQELAYVPIDSSLFAKPGEIQGWVNKFDDASIEAHAWNLWGGLTALTEQKYPVKDTADKYHIPQVSMAVFNTWWDEYEVFNPPATRAARTTLRFHGPRQAASAAGKASADVHSGEVMSFNKYSKEFLDYVDAHQFYYLKSLTDLKKNQVKAIPTDFEAKKSMMLKPTFIVASPDKPVLIPYWKGPSMTVAGTTDPDRPVSTTWTQWVLFNPTNQNIAPGTPFTTQYSRKDGSLHDTTLTQYEVVGRDYFYYLPLAPADISYIKAGNIFTIGGVSPDSMKTGDLALLIGCHVTSIEFFQNWTWQTYWWSPHPSKTPPASANVKPPFTHYDMMPCYYMIDKNKQPFISQNPYLEPSIIAPIVLYDKFSRGLGVRSNCMSCHHSAAFPTANMDPSPASMLIGSYIGAGDVQPDNNIFRQGTPNQRVQTNFMWSIILLKQAVTSPDGKDSLGIYLNPNK
ncbi:hypothetical protein [Deminuibacter soli]|uniref:Cytochrome c domain-containing protein n=1 Tax=Deminuibacter soli TaxID=2291815 RepID=A0A3E1NE80_9BACT|nr:hypothetical protein [Deminuibacter soli]RFM26270.1 hypothetical protein DXN05_20380 [Deminuibacter soli]